MSDEPEEQKEPEPTPEPEPRPAPPSPSVTSDESTGLLRELITQTRMQRETVETLMNRVDAMTRYLQQVTQDLLETTQTMREVMELSKATLIENDQQTEKLGTAVHALMRAEENLTALYQAAMEDEPLPDEEQEPDQESA